MCLPCSGRRIFSMYSSGCVLLTIFYWLLYSTGYCILLAVSCLLYSIGYCIPLVIVFSRPLLLDFCWLSFAGYVSYVLLAVFHWPFRPFRRPCFAAVFHRPCSAGRVLLDIFRLLRYSCRVLAIYVCWVVLVLEARSLPGKI